MKTARTERLLALTLLLLETPEPLTRSQIRARILDYPRTASADAFARMFERDKEDLRSLGIALQTNELPGKDEDQIGYTISRDDRYLPSVELSASESDAVAVATQLWASSPWENASFAALRKLEAVTGVLTADRRLVTLGHQVVDGTLQILLNATQHHHQVDFVYRNAQGVVTERRIVPWGIVVRYGQWYVVAFDCDRASKRIFKLSRIVGSVTVKKDPSAAYHLPPEGAALRELFDDATVEPTQSARINIGTEGAVLLRGAATKVVGGVAYFEAVDLDTLARAVCSLGGTVAVLDPPELATLVRERLTAVASAHRYPVDAQVTDPLLIQSEKKTSRAGKSSTDRNAQLTRLLALVPWLRQHPGATYAQVAERFGISEGQLLQDLELANVTEFGLEYATLDLDMYGSTLSVWEPRGIGKPLRFTPSEATALLTGLKILAALPGLDDPAPVQSAIEKIRSVAGELSTLIDLIDVSDEEFAPFDSTLETINAAVDADRQLSFDYIHATRDEVTHRTVDPINVLLAGGHMYLKAWCHDQNAARIFRLDRMGAPVVSEARRSRQDFDKQVVDFDVDRQRAVVRVRPDAIQWVENATVFHTVADGLRDTLVVVGFAEPEWLIQQVLTEGGGIEVLAPASLRQAIHERAHNGSHEST